jgi:Tfp pilus assembly protein PilF
LIAAHESVLSASPKNVASQLSLAYLYEAAGQEGKAAKIWAEMNR